MAKFKSGDYISVNFTDDDGSRTNFIAVINSVFHNYDEYGYNYQYTIILDNSDDQVQAFNATMWNTFCFESDFERKAELLDRRVAKILYEAPGAQNTPSRRR